MKKSPFITIGSKGTSIPTDLKELEDPLRIGKNGIGINGVNWSGGEHKKLGMRAHGWVSNARKDDLFRIFTLDQALAKGLIIHVQKIEWISKGQLFSGDAYFPANWKPGKKQPQYIAVCSPQWKHGCVEKKKNKRNKGKWVGKFQFLNALIPSLKKFKSLTFGQDTLADLKAQARTLDANAEFEPQSSTDGRLWTLRRIALRQGQPAFRRELLKIYGGKCAISGTEIEDILEAAHVRPYDGPSTNTPENGLLLRADLHTMFDLGLLHIDPTTREIVFAQKLKGTEYDREFAGVKLQRPTPHSCEPSQKSLSDRFGKRIP